MTALNVVVAAFPWCEAIPCPEAPIALVLSLAAGFWYGLRHPKRY